MAMKWTMALAGAAVSVMALGAGGAFAQDITIGLAMVKSGPLKTVGEATETSVDIAVEEINAKGGINGKKIKLVKFDTGSDPKQAATATQKRPWRSRWASAWASSRCRTRLRRPA